MQYYSTRDINLNKTFEEIIIQILCKSGGLYLPMDYPTFNYEEIFKNNPSYNDIAYSVLSNFIGSSIQIMTLKTLSKKHTMDSHVKIVLIYSTILKINLY